MSSGIAETWKAAETSYKTSAGEAWATWPLFFLMVVGSVLVTDKTNAGPPLHVTQFRHLPLAAARSPDSSLLGPARHSFADWTPS